MINKNNFNLQLTINKQTNDNLQKLCEKLSEQLGFKVSKSQIVSMAINSFNMKSAKENKSALNESTHQKEIEHIETANKDSKKSYFVYSNENEKNTPIQNALIRLRNKLRMKNAELANVLGISESALKKYITGVRNPTGDYYDVIVKTLHENGIKF